MMHSNLFPFVLAPLRRSLGLFWHKTHTKDLRVRSPVRLEVEKGRKIWGKSERAKGSWQRKAEENSRLEIAVQRRTQEVRKMIAKTCSPTEAGLTNARRSQHGPWLLWEFRPKYTPVVACKCTKSYTKVSHRLSPSCAWSYPKPVFVCLFFSSTLSVVFCVSVKKCVMLLVGNH